MDNYTFLAGDKEQMFDTIGSFVPSSKSEVAKDYITKETVQSTDRLPVITDNAVEKSLYRDQPQTNFNPNEIPMTQQQYEQEFGPVHPELYQIQEDEGYSSRVYKDSLGNLTVGTGHLLTPDELAKYKEGDEYPEEELDKLLLNDFDTARNDMEKFTPVDAPEEVKNIITNMAFQLGLPNLSGFKNFKQALEDKDYNKAADEMLDSKWAQQTPNRANRLADRMRAIAENGE